MITILSFNITSIGLITNQIHAILLFYLKNCRVNPYIFTQILSSQKGGAGYDSSVIVILVLYFFSDWLNPVSS